MSNETTEVQHSKLNMTSYGFGKYIVEFLNMSFGTYAYFFYESELGLESWVTGLGYIIFALWNMFNDPLLGYLTNRPFRFTKRWGRRFPWVMIGGVPYILSYLLIFSPPSVDVGTESGTLILFLWFVIFTCTYDFFASLYWVNFSAIYPDKFRSMKERRTSTGLQTIVGILGIAFGAIFPPLFVEFGVPQTYMVQGGIVVIFCFIGLALAIPGCREDQVTVDRYLELQEQQREEESFYQSVKIAFKQKNFTYFVITYTLYQTLTNLMTGSLAFVVRYVLDVSASNQLFLSVGFLVGSLVAIPFWIWRAHKSNDNRKTLLYAGIFLTFCNLPLFFITDLWIMVIFLIIWGLAFGGFWSILWPVLADVIDESVALTGKRKEGVYTGIQAFFGRLAFLFQALIFTTVHILTGFLEGQPLSAQPDSAILGIQLHFSIIPMIFMGIAMLIFWRNYKLTPDKVSINREKLSELKL
jgi:GPH family glycoside/pentoside/hexuronide:cation symporter